MLAFCDRELGIAEDHLFVVGLAHALHLADDLTAVGCRREFHQHLPQVLVLHLDPIELFQLGDQALCERGLARFRAEFVDQVLGLLDVTLLFLRRRGLLFALDLAQFHVLAPGHFTIDELSVEDLDRPLREPIEKGLVVRDQHQGGRITLQQILQPLDRGQIEVVRRLVEQQQVRPLQKDPREFRAHAPASAQFLHRPVHILAHKADPFQHALHLHVVIGRADRIETLVCMCEDRGQFDRFLVGLRIMQFPFDPLDRSVELLRLFKGFFRHLPGRKIQIMVHLLGQIAERQFLRPPDGPLVERLLSGEDLQQRAFAGAVAAHEPDPIIGADEEGDVIEHRPFTEMQTKALYRDHLLAREFGGAKVTKPRWTGLCTLDRR